MSLAQLFTVLRASRWSILLMMLVAGGVAFAFAQTLPKEYTAKARVLLDVGNPDPTQYSAVTKSAMEGYFSTEMRLVGDAGVVRQVVEKLGWADNPAVIEAWQQATGGTGDVVAWAGNRILGNIGTQQLQDSSVIEIYYSAGSLDVAKQIVGLVRTAFIDNSQRLRATAATRAARWNRAQAERARLDLLRAETARTDFARKNNMTLNNAGVSSEMKLLRESIAARGGKLANKAPQAPAPSAAMIYLQQRLNGVEASLALLAQRGPENPDFIMVQAQQQILRAQLARENQQNQALAGVAAGSTSEMRARADREYVAARLKVLGQTDVYDRLLDLERAVAMKQTRYQSAKARADQFELIAAAPSGLKIVGDVIGNDDPSFPNIPVITGIATGFGLALGIALALLGEMMAHRVRSSEDLEFSSQVPVLAVIARRDPKTRKWWPFGRRRAAVPAYQPAE